MRTVWKVCSVVALAAAVVASFAVFFLWVFAVFGNEASEGGLEAAYPIGALVTLHNDCEFMVTGTSDYAVELLTEDGRKFWVDPKAIDEVSKP